MTPRVSCIIPAYNEERTISQTVDTAFRYGLIDDVIVVSDGSTDRTVARAEAAGARVVRLSEHRGKAHAMQVGISHAKGDILLFLDANIIGLNADAISRLLRPVLDGRYTKQSRLPSSAYKLGDVFVLRGEHALEANVWQSIPAAYKPAYSMELALRSLKRLGRNATYIFAPGLTVFVKETHHNVLHSIFNRFVMMTQLAAAAFILYAVRG